MSAKSILQLKDDNRYWKLRNDQYLKSILLAISGVFTYQGNSKANKTKSKFYKLNMFRKDEM